MCSCQEGMVDLDLFYWKSLQIISTQFTLRQLISEPLQKLIGLDQILDKQLTIFEAVACTSLYVLTDKEKPYLVQIHIGMESNEIEYIRYFDTKYKSISFQHYCNSITKEISQYPDYIDKEYYTFSEDNYKVISRCNQELLDSIRVKCENGQIANKDGSNCE